MSTKTAFYEDLAEQVEYWSQAITQALTTADSDLSWTEQQSAFVAVRDALVRQAVEPELVRNVINECLVGMAHSFLVTIDGGTSLSDEGRRLHLVDENGEEVDASLHDGFVGHLTERTK